MTSNQEQPIKVVRSYTTGIIKIMENTQFNYLEAERVEVLPGIKTRIFGTVRDLVVHQDCKVFVHGRITGTITNNGGRLYVYNP